jgi:hypothetical protein
MTENSVQFLPFHAINEFMRADFRLIVVRKTLSNLKLLPAEKQDKLNRLIRRTVKIPGFRNSEKAPAAVKVLPAAKAFESDPGLAAGLLSAWKDLHPELSSQVYQVLKHRGWFLFPEQMKSPADLPSLESETDWGILPLEADRTLLPGFLTFWPAQQEFESIYETFTGMFPDSEHSLDEVSLMAVWLSNRLPYQIREVTPEIDLTNQDENHTP